MCDCVHARYDILYEIMKYDQKLIKDDKIFITIMIHKQSRSLNTKSLKIIAYCFFTSHLFLI